MQPDGDERKRGERNPQWSFIRHPAIKHLANANHVANMAA
jgi:hypothetical protein